MPLRLAPFVCLAALLAAGCAPTLSPLYRDYEARRAEVPVEERIADALETAGWTLRPADAPNAVATEPRRVSNWGLYRVVVHLEAVPVGDDHVRLYVHPYRRFFTGGRSKIPFLNGRLRRQLVGDLNEAFAAHDLQPLGTSVQRDREATD